MTNCLEHGETILRNFGLSAKKHVVQSIIVIPRGTRGVGDDDNIILIFAFEGVYLVNKLNVGEVLFLSLWQRQIFELGPLGVQKYLSGVFGLDLGYHFSLRGKAFFFQRISLITRMQSKNGFEFCFLK